MIKCSGTGGRRDVIAVQPNEWEWRMVLHFHESDYILDCFCTRLELEGSGSVWFLLLQPQIKEMRLIQCLESLNDSFRFRCGGAVLAYGIVRSLSFYLNSLGRRRMQKCRNRHWFSFVLCLPKRCDCLTIMLIALWIMFEVDQAFWTTSSCEFFE